jgi:hypothetical protein
VKRAVSIFIGPFSEYGLFDKITESYPAAIWEDNLLVQLLSGDKLTLRAANPNFFEKLKDYLNDRSLRLPPQHCYGKTWTL